MRTCRGETGKIYWLSELNPTEEEGQIPDDLETSDLYLEIPHKNDLDLGRELVLRFVDEHLPAERNRIADLFRRRGAYRRFRAVLAVVGRLEEWYSSKPRRPSKRSESGAGRMTFH